MNLETITAAAVGMAIGTAVPWILTWIAGIVGRHDLIRRNMIANLLLEERNAIGNRQADAMEEIGATLQKIMFNQSAAERTHRLARRERLVSSAMEGILSNPNALAVCQHLTGSNNAPTAAAFIADGIMEMIDTPNQEDPEP